MTHPTDDSLKPCPFCGGAASLHPRTCDKNTPYNPADRAFPIARCGQCGAEAVGKDWGRPETAAEKWNTRALLAEQARTEPTDKQAVRNEIGGIMLPGDGVQDNLAIALATYFEQDRECPEDGEKDECGWKVWAIERVNYVLDEITKLVIAQPFKAEQAKDAAEDAELLEWLEEKHYALHPIKEDQGDDTYTLWWQVTDKRKSISGHPLGNIRAAIRAARAAERKA